MAFDQSWSEAYLGATTRQDDIDLIVQNTRIGVRERMTVEHIAYAAEADNLDVWLHRKTAARCNFGLAAAIPVAPTAVGTSGLVDGSMYYETDTGLLKYYDETNTTWVTIATPDHSAITTTYTAGTVAVTLDSAVITGTGTEWSANVGTSEVFLGPDSEYYGITSVDSDTQITLSRTYDGTNASGQSYTLYLDGHPQYLPKGGGTINGTLTVDGAVTLGSTLAMGANKITGLADGTAATDAATFGQVAFSALTANDSDANAMVKTHAYKAVTDGFVVAVQASAVSALLLRGYVGATNDPAGAGTLVQIISSSSNLFASISFSVAKDEYFEVICAAGGNPSIYWRSAGTLSAPEDQD